MKKSCAILCLFVLSFSGIGFAAGVGRLSLSSSPSSNVSLDGTPIGKTPIDRIKVTPGRHHVQLKKATQGSSFEFEISIAEGKHMNCSYNFDTGEQQCAAEKSQAKSTHGILNLYSEESGAEVILDGKNIGKTPLEDIRVGEGHHVLEFSREGTEPIVKDVDVEASQTVKVTVQFPAPKKAE